MEPVRDEPQSPKIVEEPKVVAPEVAKKVEVPVEPIKMEVK